MLCGIESLKLRNNQLSLGVTFKRKIHIHTYIFVCINYVFPAFKLLMIYISRMFIFFPCVLELWIFFSFHQFFLNVVILLQSVASKGNPNEVEIIRYQVLIPVTEVQVRASSAKDMESHFLWELIHLRSQLQRRSEKVYVLSNRYVFVISILKVTAECRTGYLAVILYFYLELLLDFHLSDKEPYSCKNNLFSLLIFHLYFLGGGPHLPTVLWTDNLFQPHLVLHLPQKLWN